MSPVRVDSSFSDREFSIRYYQVGIDFLFVTKAGTDRTGAVRIIETEITGSYFAETESTVHTGEML